MSRRYNPYTNIRKDLNNNTTACDTSNNQNGKGRIRNLEEQNEEEIEKLINQVDEVKQIARRIGEEARWSNDTLSYLSERFDALAEFGRGAVLRIKHITANSNGHFFILTGFIFFVLVSLVVLTR